MPSTHAQNAEENKYVTWAERGGGGDLPMCRFDAVPFCHSAVSTQCCLAACYIAACYFDAGRSPCLIGLVDNLRCTKPTRAVKMHFWRGQICSVGAWRRLWSDLSETECEKKYNRHAFNHWHMELCTSFHRHTNRKTLRKYMDDSPFPRPR